MDYGQLTILWLYMMMLTVVSMIVIPLAFVIIFVTIPHYISELLEKIRK